MGACFALLKPNFEHRREARSFLAIQPAIDFQPAPGLANVLGVHPALLGLGLNRGKRIASIARLAACVVPQIGVHENRSLSGLAVGQQDGWHK
jgi:hypothetical protein